MLPIPITFPFPLVGAVPIYSWSVALLPSTCARRGLHVRSIRGSPCDVYRNNDDRRRGDRHRGDRHGPGLLHTKEQAAPQ